MLYTHRDHVLKQIYELHQAGVLKAIVHMIIARRLTTSEARTIPSGDECLQQ